MFRRVAAVFLPLFVLLCALPAVAVAHHGPNNGAGNYQGAEGPGADKQQSSNHGDCKNQGSNSDTQNTTGIHNGYDCQPSQQGCNENCQPPPCSHDCGCGQNTCQPPSQGCNEDCQPPPCDCQPPPPPPPPPCNCHCPPPPPPCGCHPHPHPPPPPPRHHKHKCHRRHHHHHHPHYPIGPPPTSGLG